MSEQRVTLTVEQALGVLPEGEEIHVFRNPGVGMLTGADWDRSAVEAAIRDAKLMEIGGGMARSMGHGLVVENGGRWLFVSANAEALDAIEQAAPALAAPSEQP